MGWNHSFRLCISFICDNNRSIKWQDQCHISKSTAFGTILILPKWLLVSYFSQSRLLKKILSTFQPLSTFVFNYQTAYWQVFLILKLRVQRFGAKFQIIVLLLWKIRQMETSRPMERFFPSRVIKSLQGPFDQLHFDDFFWWRIIFKWSA